ncbi:uncharacterized protein LOC129692734 [Psammomys obesus]|uniref:uncharacterized protein LOC129692734 n=1 Tax=Psammomys obesus TaxID=48139 RepID=UPI00245307F0|nr:uncharacterized protein LOC129692734 [Psammomys obesus]
MGSSNTCFPGCGGSVEVVLCGLSVLSQQIRMFAASHEGIKEPECEPGNRPGPAAGTVPQRPAARGFPRQDRLAAASSSRLPRPRAPPPSAPSPQPRRYLRTPAPSAARPPAASATLSGAAAGRVPPASRPSGPRRTVRLGTAQIFAGHCPTPRPSSAPPRRAHAFCCHQFSRQRRSTPPAAPLWLRPKMAPPQAVPALRRPGSAQKPPARLRPAPPRVSAQPQGSAPRPPLVESPSVPLDLRRLL